MQGQTDYRTSVHIGDGQLEQLVEGGRQLHDQAVYDSFAWIVSFAVRSARYYFGNDRLNKGKQTSSERLFLNHTSKIPV